MLCVLILYISDRFFEKLFIAILFTLRVFARNLLRGNRRRNTFRISIWCLAWGSNPGFSSNKPTHFLLDHGDFAGLISPAISKLFQNSFLNRISFGWNLQAETVWHVQRLYWSSFEQVLKLIGVPCLRDLPDNCIANEFATVNAVILKTNSHTRIVYQHRRILPHC